MMSDFDFNPSRRYLEQLEKIVVPHLKLYLEVGWADHLEGFLNERIRRKVNASGRQDILNLFNDSERRLAETRALEAVHGKDFRLNVAHPAYVATMERLRSEPKSQLRRALRIEAA